VDSIASEFRNSCLDILSFLSSPPRQREFASKVEYIDYKSEFVCWWFDDLVMDSLPQGSGLISESFTADEKLILWEFTKLFERNIDSENQSIDELLKDPKWKVVMVAAQEALAKIG
jgi:phage pi2 protein 07|tara:strand:+ start:3925 stop:4272 length:348 start_codon:yes stop_codon:yes gene_type:complete